jgi:hypothetical protein
MNSNQEKQIRSQLENLKQVDVDECLAVSYPDQDLSDVGVGSFSGSDFLASLKRMIVQLENALDENGLFLPFTYVDPEIGSANLEQQLANLHSEIKARSWVNVSNHLLYCIRYQMHFGIWDLSQKRVHAGNDKKSIQVLSDLELKLKEAEKNLESLRNEKESLAESITEKRSELDEIVNLLASSRSKNEEIDTIHDDVVGKKATLTEILSTQREHLKDIESQVTSVNENDKAIVARLNEIQGLQKKTESHQADIESKRSEIYELTGKAADGSLGGTFQARFEELTKGVNFWLRIGIPVAFVIGALWLFLALFFIKNPDSDFWLSAIYLSGKLVPTILIIAFALKQYSRERSFLEEYAFKSAVAFTVNAYADQLANERFGLTEDDFGTDEDGPRTAWIKYVTEREQSRKKLIQETVEKLYTVPRVHEEKASGFAVFRPKGATEILQQAKDLVREAKNF